MKSNPVKSFPPFVPEAKLGYSNTYWSPQCLSPKCCWQIKLAGRLEGEKTGESRGLKWKRGNLGVWILIGVAPLRCCVTCHVTSPFWSSPRKWKTWNKVIVHSTWHSDFVFKRQRKCMWSKRWSGPRDFRIALPLGLYSQSVRASLRQGLRHRVSQPGARQALGARSCLNDRRPLTAQPPSAATRAEPKAQSDRALFPTASEGVGGALRLWGPNPATPQLRAQSSSPTACATQRQ